MRIINKIPLIMLLLLLISNSIAGQTTVSPVNLRTLIVFFDGLRPDYISPENMPNVYAFSKGEAMVSSITAFSRL